ncbi:hypothetical protein HYV83_04515 [Candidatus Woesearchaeota archaeon]|nr:hypothetical protein [Candidatus Woesearchaeota archaeon]
MPEQPLPSQTPSPLQYFNEIMHGGSPVGVLERKAALCYTVTREASVFLAGQAISNGIDFVKDYLPLMHDAVTSLQSFQMALVGAPTYGAYLWPNVELRDFASSFIELGASMRLNSASPSMDIVQAVEVRSTGAVIVRFGHALMHFASDTYFFSRDLSDVVAASQPSLELSRRIVDGLVLEAMSAPFAGKGVESVGGAVNGMDYLLNLVTEYDASNPARKER